MADIFAPGDVVDGRYKLVELLGDGGCAYVWLVWNVRIRQHQALKILKFSKKVALRKRFRTEALAAGELSNSPDWRSKFILHVFDVSGEDEDVQWMTMPYIITGDLWEYLGHSKPSIRHGLQMTLDIAHGLQLAHSRTVRGEPSPIIHRDLKPQNILLGADGQILIADFGIAGVFHDLDDESGDAPAGSTRIGQKMGTIGWSSPNQLDDASKKDVRDDVFSLGVILAALVADFDPGTRGELLLQCVPVQEKCLRDVPDSIRAIIVTACQTDVEQRYASIDAMKADIERVLAEFPATEPAWTIRDGKQLPVRAAPSAPAKTPPPGSAMVPEEPRPAPQTVQPMAMTEVEEPKPRWHWPLNRRQTASITFLGCVTVLVVLCGVRFWPRASTDMPAPEPVIALVAPDQAPVPAPPPAPAPVPAPAPEPEVPVVPAQIRPIGPISPMRPIPVPAPEKPKAEPKPPVVTVASVTLLHLPAEVHPGETMTVSAKLAVPKNENVASVTLRYLGSSGGAKQHAEMKVAPDGVTRTADFIVSPSLGTTVTVYADLRLESDLGTQVLSKKVEIPISSN